MDRPTLAVFILHSLWAALGRRLLPTARLRKNSAQQAQWRLCREGPRISLTPKQGTQAPHSTDTGPPREPLQEVLSWLGEGSGPPPHTPHLQGWGTKTATPSRGPLSFFASAPSQGIKMRQSQAQVRSVCLPSQASSALSRGCIRIQGPRWPLGTWPGSSLRQDQPQTTSRVTGHKPEGSHS